MLKKLLLSVLSGLAILFITWAYQNYDFSFSVEDAFFKKLTLWKYKIFPSHPRNKTDIIFINTGKDIVVVEDTLDYGSITVSNREKIYQLLRFINTTGQKPLFTALDIQFYYPYSINRSVDTLLANELDRTDRILIPVVKDSDGEYKTPLYRGVYAYSDYQTFGAGFNKFRTINHGKLQSIPVVLHEEINNAVYKDHGWYATCNDSLCLSAIWPAYFLKNDDVRGNKAIPYTQFYNLGELDLALEADSASFSTFFNNKLLIVGNFEEDMHVTPAGKMSGPVLLANIYLSLLNRQHMVRYGLLTLMLITFSALSYLAWFSRMPEVKLNFRFLFSSYLIKFIRGYISYFGCMFVLSLTAILLFNIHIALFLPSFIFAGIEYISQKKYLS